MLTSQSVPAGRTILHSISGKSQSFSQEAASRTTEEVKHYSRENLSPTASHPLLEQK